MDTIYPLWGWRSAVRPPVGPKLKLKLRSPFKVNTKFK